MSEWSFFSPVAITCAGHRGPRRRMCVSYLFLFLFFKKKLISWGCAIVSVCFPHFGGSVSTPAPVVMGLDRRASSAGARGQAYTLRCRCRGIVSGTTERAWSAPLLPASGSWLVQQQEGMRCRPQHNSTLFRCKTCAPDRQPSELAEHTAHTWGVYWFVARSWYF